MRLTLRTLLAYLDDTLDPAEIKQIGQKAAESDAAQELIARIKQVTRRRRLTAPPPTGSGAKVDPNTIADYLDNVLASEDVGELEKTCLESDVHLAEVAACHQILTLILGEPALVPPLARQRMYSLVRGREAIPKRKATPVTAVGRGAEAPPEADDDETVMGLPAGKGGAWAPWLIPAGVFALLALLAIVIFQAFNNQSQHAQNRTPLALPTHSEASTKPAPDGGNPQPPMPMPPMPMPMPPMPMPMPPMPMPPEQPGDAKPRDVGHVALVEPEVAGKTAPVSLLVRPALKGDKKDWEILKPDAVVKTGDTLVSLPGFRSIVRTPGVDVTLWGNVPEFRPGRLMESAVVLGAPKSAAAAAKSGDVDCEFYLDRGRVIVTSRKDEPVKVRVYFHETPLKPAEAWEVTLKTRGTEVALDLFKLFLPGVGFGPDPKTALGPAAAVYMVVLKGQASAKIGPVTYENLEAHDPAKPPAKGFFFWESFGPGVQLEAINPQRLTAWDKSIPERSAMAREVEALQKRTASSSLGQALEAMLLSDSPPDAEMTPGLAVYCLGAIDDLPKLLDVLKDESERQIALRSRAISTLQNWIGRSAQHDVDLYNLLKEKGLTGSNAETVMELLHDKAVQELTDRQIWVTWIEYLKHKESIIRELAFWQMSRFVPEAQKEPNKYSPAGDTNKRQVAYDAWQKLLKDGKVPPR